MIAQKKILSNLDVFQAIFEKKIDLVKYHQLNRIEHLIYILLRNLKLCDE